MTIMNKIPKNPVADDELLKRAVGEEEYDSLAEPPSVELSKEHPMCLAVVKAIKEVYDPEIPVNVYELGLIYAVYITDNDKGEADVDIKMSLTSPGCPVAQEMPGWVQGAVLAIEEGIGDVDVEVVWDPTWAPTMMAETAKMQLNMFM